MNYDWSRLMSVANAPHRNFWCNPPYSRGNQGAFMRKARELVESTDGRKVVMLVQSTTETAWFQDYVFGGVDVTEKQTIRTGPLAGTLIRMTGSNCNIDLWLLRGRVEHIDPVTKEARGTGKTGSAVVAFLPRRRLT